MRERWTMVRIAQILVALAMSSLVSGCFWHGRRERVVYVEERRVGPGEHRERREERHEERREERR